MVWVCFATLLLATVVSADYYVDNANVSVQYSMDPTQSGQGWQTLSVSIPQLALEITNSTGNYTITLDASHCYDQDYALGVCGSGDNCYVQIPFIGSGITMYVFNAGASGMTASFSIDGGEAVSNTIPAPPAPTFQVSNVSIYNIQGLASGPHNLTMTLLDWEGLATSMKFDYAYVNETLVTPQVTTSSLSSSSTTLVLMTTTTLQSQSPTPSVGSTSKKIDLGLVVGGTAGGFVAFVVLATCLYLLCKRKRKEASPFQVNPFTSERGHNVSDTPSPAPVQYHYEAQCASFFARHPAANMSINSSQFALGADILRSTSEPRPQSIVSGMATVSHPAHRFPSNGGDGSLNAAHSNVLADSPFSDSHMASPSLQYDHSHLTQGQLELADRLRMDKVPEETIARVVEGLNAPSLGFLGSDPNSRRASGEHVLGSMRPPSYRSR